MLDHRLQITGVRQEPISLPELANRYCYHSEICPHCGSAGRVLHIKNMKVTERQFLVFSTKWIEFDGSCHDCNTKYHEAGRIRDTLRIRFISPNAKEFIKKRFFMYKGHVSTWAGIVLLIIWIVGRFNGFPKYTNETMLYDIFVAGAMMLGIVSIISGIVDSPREIKKLLEEKDRLERELENIRKT